MQEVDKAELCQRAFDLVQELNTISTALAGTHTIELVDQVDVAQHQHAVPCYLYAVRISADVRPRGGEEAGE